MQLTDLTAKDRKELLLVATTFSIPYMSVLDLPFSEYTLLRDHTLQYSQEAILDKKLSQMHLDIIRSAQKMTDRQSSDFLIDSMMLVDRDAKDEMKQQSNYAIMLNKINTLGV